MKRELNLAERSYYCPRCGLVIDRDLNAAINLARWQPKEPALDTPPVRARELLLTTA